MVVVFQVCFWTYAIISGSCNCAAQPEADEPGLSVSFKNLAAVNHKSMAIYYKRQNLFAVSIKHVVDVKEHNNNIKNDESIENTKL